MYGYITVSPVDITIDSKPYVLVFLSLFSYSRTWGYESLMKIASTGNNNTGCYLQLRE